MSEESVCRMVANAMKIGEVSWVASVVDKLFKALSGYKVRIAYNILTEFIRDGSYGPSCSGFLGWWCKCMINSKGM